MTLSLSSAAQPPVITASAEWVLSSSHSAYRCRDQLDAPHPASPPPFSFHYLLRSLFSFAAAVMPSDLPEVVFDLACSLLPVRLTPSSPVSPPRRIPSPGRPALRHRALAAYILVRGRGGAAVPPREGDNNCDRKCEEATATHDTSLRERSAARPNSTNTSFLRLGGLGATLVKHNCAVL